ncbi:MAG: hypothetical protein GWN81_07945 [Phycisphaerae bacterium]|nr:hypothetical protein [Phycisphaerae bacterium]
MNTTDWKGYAELVGIAAIVASLIFVGVQLQQDRQIAIGEALTNFAESYSNVLLQSSEYAEILAKTQSEDKLTDAELIVLRHLVEVQEMNAYLQSAAIQSFSDRSIRTSELLFASFLFRYPAARAEWERHADDIQKYVDPLRTAESLENAYETGSGAFRQRIMGNLEKLDSLYK